MSKSKPKNGKTSSQDYMNLLYSDSESDTIPDLKLPPLKGKKPKRHSSRRPTEDNICSLWMVLKAVTVTILLASIVGLGIVTYWSLQQIRDLKDQINTSLSENLETAQNTVAWSNAGCCSTCYTLTCVLIVASCLLACATLIWMHLELKRDFNDLRDRMQQVENKNAGTPEEFQALQNKLASVNKTVNDLKTGKYGLDVLNKSIASIQKQITSLTAATTQLKQNVQSADPNDKQRVAVEDTVAQLGSDLHSTQATVETLKNSQKTFSSQLEALKNRVSALENPGGREGSSSASDTKAVQALLTQINANFTQSIGLIKSNLTKLQAHLDTADLFTQGLQNQLINISQRVADLAQAYQQLQANATQLEPSNRQADGGAEDEAVQAEVMTSLTELRDQVENLQQALQKVQTEHVNLTTAGAEEKSSSSTLSENDVQALQQDHEIFMDFKAEMFQDISRLNASMGLLNGSVGVLNTDVGELFAKLNTTMLDITNISVVLQGVMGKMQTLETQKDTQVELAQQTEENNPNPKNEDVAPSTTASDLNEATKSPEQPSTTSSSKKDESEGDNV